ncbi:nickel pincer cofactor biosynthesis protein LarB [Oceanirhabdus sp. W0125-5]|uniref:nickel pincer cofactor biosynthesis protein LarB n=1 Tax=Oceanirhabdus sp. W0125-5 TaxID=2999116 RepID=UPI0022F32589|nr:nickel pincer cofactor biosynthesis protein LarB [Oceanirhabdus sp. W0125-5]WBW98738.1 nickel pincer cofactor biosynthesis protein LarB [Oceanirhabdus sp. W0125-5]
MNDNEIKKLLEKVKDGDVTVEDAFGELKELPYTDIGIAVVDNHREIRVGYPEVIYCSGKTKEQIREIVSVMLKKKNNILGTRASFEDYEEVKKICSHAEYDQLSKTIVIKNKEIEITESYIAVVTAGTSDLPVAEEAAITAELFGNRVERVVDVGVAGIHRLFGKLDIIKNAKVIIVVAGMEGALPSVIGGLVDKPIIAVPTSVGYGANFGGLSALLTMLNSCASGITVVNIDNGFGAGYSASIINKL